MDLRKYAFTQLRKGEKMSKKPAALGASIIATKGSALPTVQTQAVAAKTIVNSDNEQRTAVTVRLDGELYTELKMYGLSKRKSNQDIFVAALKEFIRKN